LKNYLTWLVIGYLLSLVVDWFFRSWYRRQDQKRRAKAAHFLIGHGMEPKLYLATIGIDDPELRAALDVFSFSDYIVTKANGRIVGGFV
jgi:hypothetical protein